MFYGKIGSAALAAVMIGTVATAHLGAQILRGSQGSVDRMYSFAIENDFDFYPTLTAVRGAAGNGKLVELPKVTANYELHQVQYPYAMPAAKLFVERLAAQYRSRCGEKMVVTSAIRPLTVKLRNASDHSVHATGMAIDIRSSKIPTKCKTWLRTTLEGLEKGGVVEATEEKRPPHFHVAVYPVPYANYVSGQNRMTNTAEADAEASNGPSDSPESQVVSYLVRNGDSLWKIASKHDTSVKTLQNINKLRTDTIRPGQVILVPAQNSPRQR